MLLKGATMKAACSAAGWADAYAVSAGGAYGEMLHLLGIDPAFGRQAIQVRDGQVLDLSSSPGTISATAPQWRRTTDLDLYKTWIGNADEDCPPGSPALAYWPAPDTAWNGRDFSCADELSPVERADIEAAGRAYIFGDSALAATYRPAVERLAGQFEAAVYAIRRLRIEAGGLLRVTGAPAILLIEDFELVDGGQLLINTPCRAAIGRLEKFAA